MTSKIYVKWVDHCNYSGWVETKGKTFPPIVVESLGFLVEETEEYISIAQTKEFENKEKVTEVMCILKSCIEEIEVE